MIVKSGDKIIAFCIKGEWHYSSSPEPDRVIRNDKWEFLRTHKIKHYYSTNEEFMASARRCGINLTNQ